MLHKLHFCTFSPMIFVKIPNLGNLEIGTAVILAKFDFLEVHLIGTRLHFFANLAFLEFFSPIGIFLKPHLPQIFTFWFNSVRYPNSLRQLNPGKNLTDCTLTANLNQQNHLFLGFFVFLISGR